MNDFNVFVLGREFENDTRGIVSDVLQVGLFDPALFQQQLSMLTGAVGAAIDTQLSNLKTFDLDEITFKLELSASGKLGILGSGVSATGTGGIELKFKKKVTS